MQWRVSILIEIQHISDMFMTFANSIKITAFTLVWPLVRNSDWHVRGEMGDSGDTNSLVAFVPFIDCVSGRNLYHQCSWNSSDAILVNTGLFRIGEKFRVVVQHKNITHQETLQSNEHST